MFKHSLRRSLTQAVACGGVSLLWRNGETDLFCVENDRVQGPNIIIFELVVGEGTDGLGKGEQYFIVGCYIPPSDTDGRTLLCIEHAMEGALRRVMPLLIGNLNADLDSPRDRDEVRLLAAVGS